MKQNLHIQEFPDVKAALAVKVSNAIDTSFIFLYVLTMYRK